MILADTGYWVALFNDNDRHHAATLQITRRLQEPLITTLPVMTEVCHLLQNRRGQLFAVRFLRSHRRQAFRLFPLQEEQLQRCEALMQRYADLAMDFADASLVVLAEHLGLGRILSTDRRDFAAYRWQNQYPFHNLLDENT